MQSVNIQLNSIDKVKDFVRVITNFDSDFDMRSGRYTVDAKSILGIFSLDLAKPIELIIYDDEASLEIMEKIQPFICTQ